MQMNSSSLSSMQLMSLLMQNSSTCSRRQPPTVPLSLSVRVPMLTTPGPSGPGSRPARQNFVTTL